MFETLILSIASFVGTNIDDMFLNTLFFSDTKTKEEKKSIVYGKYIGIGILIVLSILGALGLQFLPQQYIGYLWFLPICLGIKEIIVNINSRDNGNDPIITSANKMMNTALITIANGADNIGVYIPLFTGFMTWQIILTVCIFLVLIAVWCFLGIVLAELPVLKMFLTKYKFVIVPLVYIVLGIYIILKNFQM